MLKIFLASSLTLSLLSAVTIDELVKSFKKLGKSNVRI